LGKCPKRTGLVADAFSFEQETRLKGARPTRVVK